MKVAGVILTLVFFSFCSIAQQKVPVFISGTEGHKTFRIPAIIKLPGGGLLAFAEGRVNGGNDFGDINVVMKRSSDGGHTWSSLQTVVDNDKLQAGNPAPVVDLSDPQFPQGRIFLFYNTGNNHEIEIRKGNGFKQVWYKTSVDNGQTWSEAVDITSQVHLQNKPSINPDWNFKEDWRYYANTPGHAMQFTAGKYKGRIYVAANHSSGGPQPNAMDYAAHGFYSDDHGKTFRLSETVTFPGSNESTACELAGGRLMMNSRNQKGDVRRRIVSISSDGGHSWDTTYFDEQLPDPVCEGSILTVGKKRSKNMLAFCNAADEKRRDNLTLRISYDEGQTWPATYQVDKSDGTKKDFTAYNDLVKTGKKSIGVLYERDNYSQIVFTVIKIKL